MGRLHAQSVAEKRHVLLRWLRRRYGTAAELQKAWARPDIGFDSADLLPSREARRAGTVYRDAGDGGGQSADYYEFFQELTARTIIRFASAVKRVSGRRLLTAAYYGYYFGHCGSTPYHFQDSGHCGVRHILNSPEIDICGGPYIYASRRFITEVNGISGSYPLYGKLWESEEYLRTSRGADTAVGCDAREKSHFRWCIFHYPVEIRELAVYSRD